MSARIPPGLCSASARTIRLDDPGVSEPDWLDFLGDAFDSTEPGIESLLRRAREYLRMDVAILSEFRQGRQVFTRIEGDGLSFRLQQDDHIRLEDSYCDRVVDGRLPNVIPDAFNDPEARNLDVTHSAAIGAYVGVPLRFSDGTLYGTMCCLKHSADPSLDHADLKVAELLGRLIADELERRELEVVNTRLRQETTGIRALVAALEARDGYTGEHSAAVVELSRRVGEFMGLTPQTILEMRQVATLHDVGKIGVPDAILLKSNALTTAEWSLMREHPIIGWRIVSEIPGLSHLAPAVRAEHERWDGQGYPDGLAGEEIPLASRVVFVCDSYHAMVSDRPYRAAIGWAAAIEELTANAGTQFCSNAVDALIAIQEAS